jgi:AraC-like DNA-binding protein
MAERRDAATPRAAAHVHRIFTDAWPERERADRFREVFGGDRIRVEPRADVPLRIDATIVRFPDLTLLWGRRSPLQSVFADGTDRLIFSLGGPAVAKQFGRELLLERGDAVALSGADAGALTTLQGGGIATLQFPRGALLPLLKDPRHNFARRIPHDASSLRLLRGYARSVHASGCLDVAGIPELAVAHLYDLAALAVGAGREREAVANGRGVRAARLAAIKADLLANLARDVSLGEIAARHRVSPRYVGMLFEGEGTTLTAFVREERLKRARSMLLSPRFVGRRIAEIAYEVGFNDLSYFNRSFRRHFGHAPSDVRESGRVDSSHDVA